MNTFETYRDALLSMPLIQNLEEFYRLELEQFIYLMSVSDFEKYLDSLLPNQTDLLSEQLINFFGKKSHNLKSVIREMKRLLNKTDYKVNILKDDENTVKELFEKVNQDTPNNSLALTIFHATYTSKIIPISERFFNFSYK
jgi:hypothetical protein